MSDDGLMIVKFGGPLSLPLFGHWWDGKPLIIISDVGKYTVSVYSGCLSSDQEAQQPDNRTLIGELGVVGFGSKRFSTSLFVPPDLVWRQ